MRLAWRPYWGYVLWNIPNVYCGYLNETLSILCAFRCHYMKFCLLSLTHFKEYIANAREIHHTVNVFLARHTIENHFEIPNRILVFQHFSLFHNVFVFVLKLSWDFLLVFTQTLRAETWSVSTIKLKFSTILFWFGSSKDQLPIKNGVVFRVANFSIDWPQWSKSRRLSSRRTRPLSPRMGMQSSSQ